MNLETTTSAALVRFRSDCLHLDQEHAVAWPAVSFARAEGCCDPDPDPDPDPVMIVSTRVPVAARLAAQHTEFCFARAEGCCDPDPDPDPDPVLLPASVR